MLRRDPAVLFGKFEPIEADVPNLKSIVLLPTCGDWTQQERTLEVTGDRSCLATSAADPGTGTSGRIQAKHPGSPHVTGRRLTSN